MSSPIWPGCSVGWRLGSLSRNAVCRRHLTPTGGSRENVVVHCPTQQRAPRLHSRSKHVLPVPVLGSWGSAAAEPCRTHLAGLAAQTPGITHTRTHTQRVSEPESERGGQSGAETPSSQRAWNNADMFLPRLLPSFPIRWPKSTSWARIRCPGSLRRQPALISKLCRSRLRQPRSSPSAQGRLCVVSRHRACIASCPSLQRGPRTDSGGV